MATGMRPASAHRASSPHHLPAAHLHASYPRLPGREAARLLSLPLLNEVEVVLLPLLLPRRPHAGWWLRGEGRGRGRESRAPGAGPRFSAASRGGGRGQKHEQRVTSS